MSYQKYLENMPTLIIFLSFLIPTFYVLVAPVGVPMPTDPYTDAAINVIDSLNAGDVVVMEIGAGAMLESTNGPTYVAICKRLFEKNVKQIWYCYEPTGVNAPMLSSITEADPDAYGATYGEDYVVFGYLSGQEVAIASFASDMHKAYAVDYYGNSVGSLPLMQQVQDGNDVDLVVTSNMHNEWVLWTIRQWNQAYNVDIINVATILAMTQVIPFYQSGQLVGMIGGIEGGSILEGEWGVLGRAASFIDAKAVGFVVVLLWFLLGNLIALARWGKKPEAKKR